MHLVQILLPIAGNSGQPYPARRFEEIQNLLAQRFGGLTAYSRAPAKGTWLHDNQQERDDIIIVEVMVEEMDRAWWHEFRVGLERSLDQSEIVIRAHLIERI